MKAASCIIEVPHPKCVVSTRRRDRQVEHIRRNAHAVHRTSVAFQHPQANPGLQIPQPQRVLVLESDGPNPHSQHRECSVRNGSTHGRLVNRLLPCRDLGLGRLRQFESLHICVERVGIGLRERASNCGASDVHLAINVRERGVIWMRPRRDSLDLRRSEIAK